ncbi:MAG: hypothetical protein JSR80_02505 [Verrucomicrobia bacterium]|nr:hypothetical protein [Verrucomicrobiota bacterium]
MEKVNSNCVNYSIAGFTSCLVAVASNIFLRKTTQVKSSTALSLSALMAAVVAINLFYCRRGSVDSLKKNEPLNREQILSHLPHAIDAERSNTGERDGKIFSKRKLDLLSNEDKNDLIVIEKPPEKIPYFAKGATFYAYNSEGIRDYGWGCAWRSIQTCLSAYQKNEDRIKIEFESLFHLFGAHNHLLSIYKDKYSDKDPSGLCAPYSLSSGWAEPLIGEMAMYFNGIAATTGVLNGIPAGCHNRINYDIISFETFKNSTRECLAAGIPVMIDDGTYALNIIGIGFEGKNTLLWIADPHIKEKINYQLGEKAPAGLYTVTLDEQGKHISCSLSEEEQSSQLCGENRELLTFDKKPWMYLFPKVTTLSELEANCKNQDKSLESELIFVDLAGKGRDPVINKLKEISFTTEKKCHLGVAGFFNFEVALATQAKKVILLDGNPNMVKFNKIARELLICCNDANDFKEKLQNRCQLDLALKACKFLPGHSLTHILNVKNSFLSCLENFRYMKNLAIGGDIHIFQGDFGDRALIQSIIDLTGKEGYSITSMFISNMYDWMPQEQKINMLEKSIHLIGESNNNVVIIDGVHSAYQKKSDMELNIVYYKDPLTQHKYSFRSFRNLNEADGHPLQDKAARDRQFLGAPLLSPL